MAKTNFENLRIYNLSEVLADTVWEVVRKWDSFARDTVGKQLVRAADSVGANIAADGELEILSRAFNRMTHRIEAQQRELVDANRQLDERRRFTETVLAGVSAGVMGLDAQGAIDLPNRSARARRSGLGSTPITSLAPASAAAMQALRPTPPTPKTATLWPG